MMVARSLFVVLLSTTIQCQSDNGDNSDAYFLSTGTLNSDEAAEAGEPLFLTPLLKAGNISEARRLSRVGPLPNVNFDLESYSGFVTVDNKTDGNMFFWLFSATKNASEAPLVLWLQGGPGWSSLYSTFEESGPYAIYNRVNVSLRNYTWISLFNVLYIDNPVGTGFSFSRDTSGYVRNMDEVADELYEALIQIFQIYPEYQGRDFYVTGESYAGKYTTALAYRIHQRQPAQIKMRGLVIGNGLLDPSYMMDWGDVLYPLGLIDEKQRQHFYDVQNEAAFLLQEGDPQGAFNLIDQLIIGTLSPVTYFTNVTGLLTTTNYLFSVDPSDYITFGAYLSLAGTRRAIHTGNLTFHGGQRVAEALQKDFPVSVRRWFQGLLDSGLYKIMLFSGQLDTLVSYRATTNFVRSLKWTNPGEYYEANRTVWKIDPTRNSVAGYVKKVGDVFYEVLVRNGGHSLVNEQPKAAMDMMKRFIFDIPF